MPILQGYRMEARREGSLAGPVETLPLPETLWIPLPGAEQSAARLAEAGGRVKQYQALSAPKYAPAAHAPAAGSITAMEVRGVPLLGQVWCAGFRRGKAGEQAETPPPAGGSQAEQVLRAAAAAGIADELTGRPLYQELYRLRRQQAGLLLACGVEDDPWCSSACAVLREETQQVLKGLHLAASVCGAKEIGLAAADSREARLLRGKASGLRIETADGPYPARAFLLRRLRRKGETPALLGPQALAALAAAMEGVPQTWGVATVAGDGVRRPKNIRFPAGAPARLLLEKCGLLPDASLVYVGAAHLGVSLTSLDAPLPLTARCLTALQRLPKRRQYACVGCGRCAEICPQGILPWEIHEALHQEKVNPFLLLHAQKCISCAACTAACPAGIPLAAEVSRAAAIQKSGDFL